MVGCWDIATRFLYNDLLTFHEFINIYTIIKKQTNKQKRQKQKQKPHIKQSNMHFKTRK